MPLSTKTLHNPQPQGGSPLALAVLALRATPRARREVARESGVGWQLDVFVTVNPRSCGGSYRGRNGKMHNT
jgi:hypothetical protein